MSVDESNSKLPLCYLNGDYLSFTDARLPVFDLAIMQGATVTERLRTFRHIPYAVEEHLERLRQSLELVGWKHLPELGDLEDVISQLVQKNSPTLPGESDLGVVIFVTAGQGLGDSNGLVQESQPTVCVYTVPLPFANWVHGYTKGVDLIIPSIRQVPASIIDPRIKMRSRLHWQMADQQVRRKNPRAMALLLNENDHLTETSSGNLVLVKSGVLQTPSCEETLGGISRKHVAALCSRLGRNFEYTDLTVDDLFQSDEAFLTSSTYCVMPVATLNGVEIGSKIPGEVTQRIQREWSQELGVDFVEQARQLAEVSG